MKVVQLRMDMDMSNILNMCAGVSEASGVLLKSSAEFFDFRRHILARSRQPAVDSLPNTRILLVGSWRSVQIEPLLDTSLFKMLPKNQSKKGWFGIFFTQKYSSVKPSQETWDQQLGNLTLSKKGLVVATQSLWLCLQAVDFPPAKDFCFFESGLKTAFCV
jgi:hypothetical protein